MSKILVVGSFVMDQVGTTDVFPNEGETVFGTGFIKAPGGKGANQAVQAARLGCQVTMVGKVGKDSNGREMLDTCQQAGIDTSHVVISDQDSSGCSMIIVENVNGVAKNRIIVISGANMTLTIDEVKFLEDEIKNYDLVMLQLEIPMEVNEYVARLAHENGVPVMLNSAPSSQLSDRFISYLSFISPNEHEAYDLTKVLIKNDDEGFDQRSAEKACMILREKGCKNVLITLGQSGAIICDENNKFIYSPCVKGVKVVDPTAAGDSFVGAFCTAITEGKNLEDAMSFANHTAAITVSKMGAMPSLPTREEVERTL